MMKALKPFVYGLKRLIFSKNSQDEEKISYLKITLLVIYVLCIFFSFLQFSNVTVSDVIILDPLTELETQRFSLITNIYGFLAHIFSFLIFFGFFFFLIAGDKPINEQLTVIISKTKNRRLYIVIAILILLTLLLFDFSLLIGKFTFNETESLINLYSYHIGIIILYVWLLIQPALILSGSFYFLDIITSDYPNVLSGFNRKNLIFLFIEIIATIIIIMLLFLLFGITLESRPNPQDIQPFQIITESIGFFRINFYWMLVNINLLLIVILVLFVMLLLIDKMGVMRSKELDLRALGVFIIFSLVMPLIVVLLALPTNIIISQIVIPIDLVIVLFIVFFLFLLVVINRKWVTITYIENRKGLLPWLFFFGILFIIIKTVPTAVIFYSPRLKTFRSVIDVFGLFIILFTSIFRVIMVPETKDKQKINEKPILHYLLWFKRIPTYAKILFLLYISYNAFYLSLESYSVAVLLRSTDYMANLKLEFLTATTFIGAFYAFWVYIPYKKGITTPGLFNAIENQIKKWLNRDNNQSSPK